jgi:lipid-A-disaccharide synthase
MLVILPFEEKLYRNSGVDASFVGHPLLDMVPHPATGDPLNKRPCIGLFPGSRPSIFKRHLPLIVAAAEHIKKEIDVDFKIFIPAGKTTQSQARMPFEVVTDPDYRERMNLFMAITTSGTVSLENALLGIPMVIFYRLSWPNYLLARALIRIPYITMANILANDKIVPELVQSDATPEKIACETLKYLRDAAYYETTKKRLIELRKLLGTSGATRRAAEIIMNG